MVTLKLLPVIKAILLGALILSCDDFGNPNGVSPPEDPSANDTRCLSITGNRFEKYYYQLDPASYTTNITLSSPSILGFEYDNKIDPVSYAFNRITLPDVPLRRFAENTSFTHQVTGTIAVSGKAGIAVGGKAGILYTAYSAPFEKSTSLSPYRNYNNIEPLNVLNSFTNTPGDLVLAYTGNYSSVTKKEDFRVFNMTFSAEFLKSCNNTTSFVIPYVPPNINTDIDTDIDTEFPVDIEFKVDGIYPCDLTATGSAYVSLIPVKRNFYQYRNLTATFSPGSFIADVETTSIVRSYDYDQSLNTLSIVFNDYDFPYIGNVLSYKIGVGEPGDDTPMQSKVIRIEG